MSRIKTRPSSKKGAANPSKTLTPLGDSNIEEELVASAANPTEILRYGRTRAEMVETTIPVWVPASAKDNFREMAELIPPTQPPETVRVKI